MLALQIRAARLPAPEREAKLVPGRRYRWDFAWIAHKIALEVQGGVWTKGGHSTGTGITRDCEKASLAALEGYRTLFVTPAHIREGKAIGWLENVFGRTGGA